jgi:hypothetical protein
MHFPFFVPLRLYDNLLGGVLSCFCSQCTSGSWNAAVDGSDVIFIWKIGANNTVVTRKKSVSTRSNSAELTLLLFSSCVQVVLC